MCLVLTLANLWLLRQNWRTPSPNGPANAFEIVTAIGYLSLAGIGSLMLARRRQNIVGGVFFLSGLLLAASALASEYGSYGVLTSPGSLPAVRLVTWLGSWGWWAGAGLGLTFGLMLYPNGRLPSSRWFVVAGAAAVNLVVLVALHAVTAGPLYGEFGVVANPVGVASPVLRRLRDASWLLLTANSLVAVGALLARARTASSEDRRHLQWLVIPATAAVVAAPLWGLSGTENNPSTVSQWLVPAAILGTPVAVALATRRTSRLTRSLERLMVAREDERQRIRRDLHDGLGPTLAGVALQLDVARTLVHEDPAAAEHVLDSLMRQVKDGMADVRRLVDDLRPSALDQLGLVPAIKEGAQHLSGRPDEGGLAVTVEADGDMSAVPPATEVTAFRIVMEAVTNASRHANARSCAVYLAVDGALKLRVEDDGAGLSREYVPGVGLASMCERAREVGGCCEVETRPGGGTVVLATLPIGPA